ncbi:MAG: hypothetical protein H3C35_10310 [Bacteroidetes bacterium]|nr:hypothetical protein [Bacteroidota bacterium]
MKKILFLSIAIPIALSAQFINRDELKNDQGYLNYSGRNYENYAIQFNKRKIYDNFGNFLVDGLSIYDLGETQDPIQGESKVLKTKYYNLWFNNLLIGNDSYGGFTSRLMVGEAIRTKFTSLTFDKARFNGIRWDAATNKYRGTVLASRESDPLRLSFDAVALPNAITRTRNWTTYLLGGHFETDLGDVLTIGATFVNQHQIHNTINSSESSMKGDVANGIPRVIFVRVKDDTPNDLSGPIVYGLPKVYINGQEHATKIINGGVPDQYNTNLNNPIQYWVFYDANSAANFDINNVLYTFGAQPRDVGGILVTDQHTSYTQYAQQFGNKPVPTFPVELRGRKSITFAFVMPFGVSDVKISLLLANDYLVEAAHDYLQTMISDTYQDETLTRNHYDPNSVAIPTPFFPAVRAEGNVQDASNKKWVTYTYGLNTGMSLYGMNFKFQWNGFELEGELNTSSTYRKYPLLSAPYSEQKGLAYYLRGVKKIGRLTLGGEFYRIEPTYSTDLNIYTLENSYYSALTPDRQISYIPPDMTLSYNSGSDPRNYPTNGPEVILPGGAFYSLVDDNDDNDRWEDGFYFYNATVGQFAGNTDVLHPDPRDVHPYNLGYRQNINELSGFTDIIRKPDTGIFPGKDKDRDGIPDDDRNSNGIPDYQENFMTYYSDPPDFEAGDDWNNNGVIDEQENDIYPDYPYEPDIKGYHYFGFLEAAKNLSIGVGIINQEAIARGGKNAVNYFKGTYDIAAPRFGALHVYYTLKRVHDNIANNGYQFGKDKNGNPVSLINPTPGYVLDPLLYRNSLVHTLYLGTQYKQIANLNIENNIRYESNTQYQVGFPSLEKVRLNQMVDEQFFGLRTSIALVNKIDYAYSLLSNRLVFRPQFKIRTLKVVTVNRFDNGLEGTTINTNVQTTIPIFRIDYRLTESTELHFGVQGTTLFGLTDGLLYKERDLRTGLTDYNSNTTAISLTNKTQYSGYNIVIDFGVNFTNKHYLNIPQTPTFNPVINSSLIYFSIFAGY